MNTPQYRWTWVAGVALMLVLWAGLVTGVRGRSDGTPHYPARVLDCSSVLDGAAGDEADPVVLPAPTSPDPLWHAQLATVDVRQSCGDARARRGVVTTLLAGLVVAGWALAMVRYRPGGPWSRRAYADSFPSERPGMAVYLKSRREAERWERPDFWGPGR